MPVSNSSLGVVDVAVVLMGVLLPKLSSVVIGRLKNVIIFWYKYVNAGFSYLE